MRNAFLYETSPAKSTTCAKKLLFAEDGHIGCLRLINAHALTPAGASSVRGCIQVLYDVHLRATRTLWLFPDDTRSKGLYEFIKRVPVLPQNGRPTEAESRFSGHRFRLDLQLQNALVSDLAAIRSGYEAPTEQGRKLFQLSGPALSRTSKPLAPN